MSTSCEAWDGMAFQRFEYPAIGQAHLAGLEQKPERDPRIELDEAHAAGVREGEERVRAQADTAVRRERESMAAALQQFARDRDSYFKAVEREVIELALGIARKVLHREAQLDRLMLAGAVRVALGKLTESTEVKLRVHPSRCERWRQWMSSQELTPRPQVMADEALHVDACVLSTALGSVELGWESQLKEIERGLFDLLAQRPGAQP